MHHHSIATRLPNKLAAVTVELAKGRRLDEPVRRFVKDQRARAKAAEQRAKKAGQGK